MRNADGIGRIGGEEFMLMLIETSTEQAMIIANRIRSSVQGIECVKQLRVTASIGITTLRGEDASFEMLLARADRALYQAKDSGRNQVCTATEIA